MRILFAEDDPVSRQALQDMLRDWGYEVLTAANGAEAWEVMRRPDAPPMAVLDWLMPECDGLEVVRRIRALRQTVPAYLLLLTVKGEKEAIVTGLRSGANDYVTKPFDSQELKARLDVGRQMLALQRQLADRVAELEEALAQVRQLSGLLPICCYCKNIRDDANYWHRVEEFISRHTDARFSHSICPKCYAKEVAPWLKR